MSFQDELRDKENRLKLVADALASDYAPDKYRSFHPPQHVRSNSGEGTSTSEYHSSTLIRSQTPRAARVSKLHL